MLLNFIMLNTALLCISPAPPIPLDNIMKLDQRDVTVIVKGGDCSVFIRGTKLWQEIHWYTQVKEKEIHQIVPMVLKPYQWDNF